MQFQAKHVVDWSVDDERPVRLRPDCDCVWTMRTSGGVPDLFAPRVWEFWVVVEHPPNEGAFYNTISKSKNPPVYAVLFTNYVSFVKR